MPLRKKGQQAYSDLPPDAVEVASPGQYSDLPSDTEGYQAPTPFHKGVTAPAYPTPKVNMERSAAGYIPPILEEAGGLVGGLAGMVTKGMTDPIGFSTDIALNMGHSAGEASRAGSRGDVPGVLIHSADAALAPLMPVGAGELYEQGMEGGDPVELALRGAARAGAVAGMPKLAKGAEGLVKKGAGRVANRPYAPELGAKMEGWANKIEALPKAGMWSWARHPVLSLARTVAGPVARNIGQRLQYNPELAALVEHGETPAHNASFYTKDPLYMDPELEGQVYNPSDVVVPKARPEPAWKTNPQPTTVLRTEVTRPPEPTGLRPKAAPEQTTPAKPRTPVWQKEGQVTSPTSPSEATGGIIEERVPEPVSLRKKAEQSGAKGPEFELEGNVTPEPKQGGPSGQAEPLPEPAAPPPTTKRPRLFSRVWHGTKPENIASIRKEGLKPGTYADGEPAGPFVYMDKADAASYAGEGGVTLPIDIPKSWMRGGINPGAFWPEAPPYEATMKGRTIPPDRIAWGELPELLREDTPSSPSSPSITPTNSPSTQLYHATRTQNIGNIREKGLYKGNKVRRGGVRDKVTGPYIGDIGVVNDFIRSVGDVVPNNAPFTVIPVDVPEGTRLTSDPRYPGRSSFALGRRIPPEWLNFDGMWVAEYPPKFKHPSGITEQLENKGMLQELRQGLENEGAAVEELKRKTFYARNKPDIGKTTQKTYAETADLPGEPKLKRKSNKPKK